MLQEFSSELRKRDSVFSVVNINKIAEIESEITSQRNILFFENNHHIDDYNFEPYKDKNSINSIFIIATPSPIYILRMKSSKEDIDIKIPPIYGNRNQILEDIKNTTAKIFGKHGFSTFPVILPKKLLAVCSGMAQYGNNGLTYINGMGSYFRLTAFASDFRSDHYTWLKPSMMKTCQYCGKCIENCPTKALKRGNPWVNINRCITEFNERDGTFPDWIHSDWHNCLVGCIRCQEVCPYNSQKGQIKIIPIERSEVNDIINIKRFDDLSEHLKRILITLNMDRYYSKLKRNIGYLIKQ
jgi:epoxyqueuosine reductase